MCHHPNHWDALALRQLLFRRGSYPRKLCCWNLRGVTASQEVFPSSLRRLKGAPRGRGQSHPHVIKYVIGFRFHEITDQIGSGLGRWYPVPPRRNVDRLDPLFDLCRFYVMPPGSTLRGSLAWHNTPRR